MLKSIFNEHDAINADKIIKKCKKYNVISFDVFDTLLKRNVSNPNDIFLILNEFAKGIGVKGFYNLRISVESLMRDANPYITIDDIYDEISIRIGKENSKKLKEKEISIEKAYSQKNEEIFSLLDKLKKRGKRIIAISDMYLSEKIINEMLIKAGIKVDKLYVSCEQKAKKKNGSLFKHVLAEEKIKNNEIIHIGDNIKVDFFGAKKANIASIHISHKLNYFNIKKYKRNLIDERKYNTHLNVINNNLLKENSYYSKFGFSVLGPMIYSYCVWLRKECKNNDIKKIFFFSRDGYLLKKAFDSLFPDEFKTNYIYFSRRAIRVPYISIDSSYENVIKSLPTTKLINMKVLFENLGLNSSNYIKVLEKHKMNIEDHFFYDELFKKEKYKKIYNEIHDDILKEARKEYAVFKKYLKQEKFDSKISIVDIGWHNSMQYYLEKIAERDNLKLDMYGMYLGRQSSCKPVKNAKSFIQENNTEYVDSVLSFIGLIESPFLANEGSTETYYETNNKVIPQLLKYEYKKDDIENKAFTDIKKGVIDYINIVKNLPNFEIFSLNGKDSYLPLKAYGTNPYLRDIKYFSNFRYLSEEIAYFANPKSNKYYLFHFKDFIKDMYNARWKIGFLKEMAKINLPYYKIYAICHKKRSVK